MPWKDPDIEGFTKLVKQRAAARGEMTIPQRRVQFETDMRAIPIAPRSSARPRPKQMT